MLSRFIDHIEKEKDYGGDIKDKDIDFMNKERELQKSRKVLW